MPVFSSWPNFFVAAASLAIFSFWPMPRSRDWAKCYKCFCGRKLQMFFCEN
jgi:hypothetical protein